MGNEYGATTGRPRQIGWLNLDDIIKSIKINGVNKLIINKVDVLEEVSSLERLFHRYGDIVVATSDFPEFPICVTILDKVDEDDEYQ